MVKTRIVAALAAALALAGATASAQGGLDGDLESRRAQAALRFEGAASRGAAKDDDTHPKIECVTFNCARYRIVEPRYERLGSRFDDSYIWADKSVRKLLARQPRDGVWTRLGKAVISPVAMPVLLSVDVASDAYREKGLLNYIGGTVFGALAAGAGVLLGIAGLFVNLHYATGGE